MFLELCRAGHGRPDRPSDNRGSEHSAGGSVHFSGRHGDVVCQGSDDSGGADSGDQLAAEEIWCDAAGHQRHHITALFFFSFGAYFSFHQFDMVEEFRKYRTTSYYVYVLSALYLLAYTYFSGNIKRVVMFGFADSENDVCEEYHYNSRTVFRL